MATWNFDNVHSSVGFSVRHLMISKVRGHFNKWGGTFEYDPKNDPATKLDVQALTPARSIPAKSSATRICARPTFSTPRSSPSS